jgi:hypothetical protein
MYVRTTLGKCRGLLSLVESCRFRISVTDLKLKLALMLQLGLDDQLSDDTLAPAM